MQMRERDISLVARDFGARRGGPEFNVLDAKAG